MTSSSKRLAILTSGGPAPGINSVINALTLEALNLGWQVFGIKNGFGGLLHDDLVELSVEDVAWIHYEGGSILGMSRTHPAPNGDLTPVINTLRKHKIDFLVTIGGDGTASGSHAISEAMGHQLRTVHIPKTIDNDLPLPEGVPTFGYTTARSIGVQKVQHLMRDARTCQRWYLVVTMGRQAGHIALGIGKAAGATLTLIPEEFSGQPATLDLYADILDGAVIKSIARGRKWGVAILAEGLTDRLATEELEQFSSIQRDSQGRIRLSNLELGVLLSKELARRSEERNDPISFNEIKIGYELRCARPVPSDMEYCRDLGFAAARFLAEGGTDAIVIIDRGQRSFLPFNHIRDPSTGQTRVRLVDTTSESYTVARRYMQRLTRGDFRDVDELKRLARIANLSMEGFRERYAYLVENEPQSFSWRPEVRDALPQI